tara:strand:- start:35785 stop:37686 length:1902 start_codon:yes stop_codon:yes gene_type:complete
MCGISGLIGKNVSEKEINLCVTNSEQILKNRGPDFFEYKKLINFGVVCQSLLSISNPKGLDKQPFISSNGLTSFNGEIYNYLSIRDELINSDKLCNQDKINYCSEVSIICKLYEIYGVSGFKKLNGMFAIAIFSKGTKDIREPHLILLRDRMGVKPLFYGISNKGNLIYSSSCLLFNRTFPNQFNHLLEDSILSLLVLGHLERTKTLISNVFQLAAGECLIYKIRSKKITKFKYWSIEEESKNRIKKPIEFKESIELLYDSINIRSNASNGVGCLLSGGIDSSLISLVYKDILGRKINTYSLAFKNDIFDESKDAIFVANQIDSNHTSILYPGVSAELLENTLKAMNGFPIGDTSSICAFYLYQELKNYERAFLGGDGGDEIFGGYSHHNYENKFKIIDFLPIKEVINILKKLGFYNISYPIKLDRLSAFENGFENVNYSKQKIFWPKSLKNILLDSFYLKLHKKDPMNNLIKSKGNFKENYSKMRLLDINNKLVNMFLPKTDMISMANSIEIREPLLDFRLVSLLIRKGEKDQIYKENISRPLEKFLLKKMIPSYNFNKKKQGFSSPIDIDLRNNIESLMYLRDTISYSYPLFNKIYTEKLIKEQINGKNNSSRIFTLAVISKCIKDLGLIF